MRFNEQAETYAAQAHIQADLAAWTSEWLQEGSGRSSALELGAGPGVFTEYLLDRFSQVHATDISPAMIKVGEAAYPAANWSLVDGWQPSVGRYDATVSASLMQWCPQPTEALRRQALTLKPGGRLLHGFYVDPTLTEFRSLAPGWLPLPWRSQSAWLAHVEAAGLRILRAGSLECRYDFSDARALLRFFQLTGAVSCRRASPGRLRRFMREYERRFATADGVSSTWQFFRIEAQWPE
ncbi:MAG: methyltransferase [Verrucomicrobiota bacterium]